MSPAVSSQANQCRRKPEWAPIPPPPPKLQRLALNFLATFLVVTVHEVQLYEPLYVAFSSVTLPLCQHIMPFTTNRPFHFQGHFTPWCGPFTPFPLVEGSGGGVVTCAGSEAYSIHCHLSLSLSCLGNRCMGVTSFLSVERIPRK